MPSPRYNGGTAFIAVFNCAVPGLGRQGHRLFYVQLTCARWFSRFSFAPVSDLLMYTQLISPSR